MLTEVLNGLWIWSYLSWSYYYNVFATTAQTRIWAGHDARSILVHLSIGPSITPYDRYITKTHFSVYSLKGDQSLIQMCTGSLQV